MALLCGNQVYLPKCARFQVKNNFRADIPCTFGASTLPTSSMSVRAAKQDERLKLSASAMIICHLDTPSNVALIVAHQAP
jgi:hypothetical protein